MQTKQEILHALEKTFDQTINWIAAQNNDKFEFHPPEKWTTGQHLDHLIKAIAPINTALKMPRLALRSMFGKPNREGRNYQTVVQRYQEKLAGGAVAAGRYLPKTVSVAQKETLIQQFAEEKDRLLEIVGKWREKDLDNYLLPHPLLGKVSIREMLFFTAYHNQHHNKTLAADY